jgi:hypothetical protein
VAGSEVVQIEAAGLHALASRVPLAEFGEEALRRNLNDLAWLEATARAHQDVLDATAGASTIVPLRLCTIYANEERVRELLVAERERFAEALHLLRGKSEWGVKAYAQPVAAEAAPDREPVGGGAYFDRKRREREAREQAIRAVDESVHEVHAALAEWATDAVVNRPQNRDLAGYEGEMVLNAAYLIDDDRVSEFEAMVDAFDERHREAGLRFELTGPWPPYNFVPGGGSTL